LVGIGGLLVREFACGSGSFISNGEFSMHKRETD
jgi:hypothetical protein